MITEEDIRYLRKLEKPTNTFLMRWLPPIAMVLLIAGGIVNQWLAVRFAAIDGLSFTTFLQQWFNGIDVHKLYSGVYLKALERWDTALLQFGLALGFLLPLWIFNRIEIRRKKRILRFIEDHLEKQT